MANLPGRFNIYMLIIEIISGPTFLWGKLPSVTATIDVEKRMVNPFIVESEWDSENREPLVNIATGLVTPSEVCHD